MISYTLLVVSIGTTVIAFLGGVLSAFFVSQERSILGDTIAHSSLPGVVLAFMILGMRVKSVLLLGALISSIAAVLLVIFISWKTKLKEDVAIGITLSFFFSTGVALLSFTQSTNQGSSSGLEHFLFGNVAFLRLSDLLGITSVTIIILFIIFLFWKEFKLILFDRDYAINVGLPVKKLEVLLMLLISTAIVLGIESIGIVLIAGLLIAPAIAARQWTNGYSQYVLISAILGALGGFMGTILSVIFNEIPPGPLVIVILFIFVCLSLLIGVKNGILVNWIHQRLLHWKVDHEMLLRSFIQNVGGSLESGKLFVEINLENLPDLSRETINTMVACGYCKWISSSRCILTYKGIQATQQVMIGGNVE